MTLREDVIDRLRRGWPASWSEELRAEVDAFLDNRPASLPSLRQETVFWATTAPDERTLRFAVEDVRAWVVPTFAVEDGLRTVGKSVGRVGERLLECSPSGYLAWRCSLSQFPQVLAKLTILRQLLETRASSKETRPRSLLEMRRRFDTALAGRDRASAGLILDSVAQSGMETASNLLFMRVRMWERFREYEEIVRSERVRTLTSITLPREIRAAIVRAYYWTKIGPHAGLQERFESYVQDVDPHIGSLVASTSPEAGDEVLEAQVYFAAAQGDTSLVNSLQPRIQDERLLAFIAGIAFAESPESEVGPEKIVPRPPEEPTWDDLCDWLNKREWAAVDPFLREDDRPSIVDSAAATRERLIDTLWEVLTGPDGAGPADDVLRLTLLAAVEDVRADSRYPRSELRRLYAGLLELWQEIHGGSANAEDRAVFLLLLEATLQIQPDAVQLALEAVRGWWRKRSCHATDGFLIQCLGSVCEYAEDLNVLRGLWYAGLDRAKSRSPLRASDRRHWHTLGSRLGIQAADLSQVGPDPAQDAETDPLQSCPHARIAIVSGKESPSRAAAEEIATRSEANVFVVNSSVADAATDRARNADCVLLVWAAISHSVFRAFDGARDKLVYVPGTGSSSIVMALEDSLEG